MKKGIIIFQRLLPHYRIGFFKKFCSRKFSDTKILYGQPQKSESLRNENLQNGPCFESIKNIYFNKNSSVFISGIYRKIFRYKPEIIISVFNVGNLNIYVLFFLKFFLKFKLILWSFGYEPSRGFDPSKYFTDKVRLYLSQKADAVIFYWANGMEEVKKFSKRTDHYFIANNTLDTEAQIRLKENFDKTGKEKLKAELGVNEKFHFVYVGRLLKDKEIDLLLNAFSILENENTDCRLTIIGDGPEKDKLQKISKDLSLEKINFQGEIIDEEITGKWIYISDAFVMPGRLGLSVVHSFCFGTPVISQEKDKYFHGEGIGYIKNGVNGLLSKDGDAKNFSELMLKVINDHSLSDKLRENAFNTAKGEASIDNMLSGFERAIEYVNQK